MYKLINLETKQEFICEKVVVGGYEYYAYSEKSAFVKGAMFITIDNIIHSNYGYNYLDRVIIATNNPSLDIPQIVDEVEDAYLSIFNAKGAGFGMFKDGYNKAKEQYTNTKQDMIEFAEFCATKEWSIYSRGYIDTPELLELFENSRPKTIYFK